MEVKAPSARPRHRGFSLAEMVLTLGVMVIIVVAANGLLSVASRSVDASGDRRQRRELSDALERLRIDLSEATAISMLTANEVRFTVPDRDGDLVAESLGYSWSGTSGSPLQRRTNGTLTVLVDAVSTFQLAAITAFERLPSTEVTSPEFLLAASADASGPLSLNISLGATDLRALVVEPALPPGTLSWEVTRLRVRGNRGLLTSGVMAFDLRQVAAGVPGTPLGSTALVNGTALPLLPEWFQASFPSFQMPVSQRQVAVAFARGSLPALTLETSATAGGWTSLQTLSGSTWTTSAGAEPVFELYGKVRMLGPGAETVVIPAMHVVLGASGGEESLSMIVDMRCRPANP